VNLDVELPRFADPSSDAPGFAAALRKGRPASGPACAFTVRPAVVFAAWNVRSHR
jgi:hypothetical protein